MRAGDLDPEIRAQLDRAVQSLQLRADRELSALLSADQFAALQKNLPLIFEFERGGRVEVHVENGRGF